MKNIKLKYLRIALVAVLGVTAILSCKKDEHKVEVKSEKLLSNYEKERRFLSIALGVPMDKVVYDEKAKQFIVGTKVILSLEKVLELYAEANEYKLVYEN